jgi:hypothetical protein
MTLSTPRPYLIIILILLSISFLKGAFARFSAVARMPLVIFASLFTLLFAISCIGAEDSSTATSNTLFMVQGWVFLILLLLLLDCTETSLFTMKTIAALAAMAFFISLANFYWRDDMWVTSFSLSMRKLSELEALDKYALMYGSIVLGQRIMYAGLEPNYWGTQLQFPFWLAVGLMGASHKLTSKLLWGSASTLVLLGILGSCSRSSFLTLIAIGVLFSLRNATKVVLPLTILALACYVFLLMNPLMMERYSGILESATTTGGTGRLALWDKVQTNWANSFLVGSGPSSFFSTFGQVTHNTYLQTLYELGIIGLGLYLSIIYVGLRSWYLLIVLAKSQNDNHLRWLAEGGFMGTLATCVNCASITAQDAGLVWLPLAIGAALYAHTSRSTENIDIPLRALLK